MQCRDNITLFGNSSSVITNPKLLEAKLTEELGMVVGYEPYPMQVELDKTFDRDNKGAEALVQQYVNACDVNASNNVGMTLLHVLLLSDRPDLAKYVMESPQFKKINFKCCIPAGLNVMYASALDIAIDMFQEKDSAVDLPFLETLLKYGAVPPNPTKKFLVGEFVNQFYPGMVLDQTSEHMQNHKPTSALIELFSLLHRYGFSIDKMEEQLNLRLFDTEDESNNRAEEFSERFKMPVDVQKIKLAEFMSRLRAATKDLVKTNPVVMMDAERLDNGEDTLSLPFDPMDRPCCIM